MVQYLELNTMLSWLVYILAFLIGLVQTPLIVDLLRLLLPGWNIKRLTNQAASTLLIVLMAIFAITGLGFQVVYFIPLFPNVPFRNFKIACHGGFAYWVWGNMVVNYCMAVFAHAGSVVISETKSENNDVSPKKGQGNKNDPDRPTDCVDTQDQIGTKKHRYCKKCQAVTSYMDHHCPFTGNCVGLNTYAHFFLTLCYGSIGLGYSLTMSCFYFGDCLFPNVWSRLQLDPLDTDSLEMLGPLVELFMPTLGGFIVLNTIIGFHVFLLLSDMTTFDVLNNFWKAPVFKIGYQRFLDKKYVKKESRLNVLLLSKRKSPIWFLMPVRNI